MINLWTTNIKYLNSEFGGTYHKKAQSNRILFSFKNCHQCHHHVGKEFATRSRYFVDFSAFVWKSSDSTIARHQLNNSRLERNFHSHRCLVLNKKWKLRQEWDVWVSCGSVGLQTLPNRIHLKLNSVHVRDGLYHWYERKIKICKKWIE